MPVPFVIRAMDGPHAPGGKGGTGWGLQSGSSGLQIRPTTARAFTANLQTGLPPMQTDAQKLA